MKQMPRKLVLDTDALRVEAFSTQTDPTEQPGTVRAHVDDSKPYTCGCPTQNTHCQQYSCPNNSCACPSWSGPECGTICVG